MTMPAPTTSGPPKPRSARARGLIIGAAIGGTVAILAALPTQGDSSGIPMGPGALLAAIAGGWLFGPAAMRARSKKRIALVLVAFAGLATLIGDVVASIQVVFRTMPGGISLDRAVDGIGDSLTLAGFGILLVGPLVFPLALGAATLWWFLLTESNVDASGASARAGSQATRDIPTP